MKNALKMQKLVMSLLFVRAETMESGNFAVPRAPSTFTQQCILKSTGDLQRSNLAYN